MTAPADQPALQQPDAAGAALPPAAPGATAWAAATGTPPRTEERGAWAARATLLLGGAWVIGDGLHLPLASVLGLSAAAGGWWLLGRRRRRPAAQLPRSNEALIERCEQVLEQFSELAPEALEGGEADPGALRRRADLDRQRQRRSRSHLELALVGVVPPDSSLQAALLSSLRTSLPLRLHWGHPLPARSTDWRWPDCFADCDGLLYHLRPPLRALDLRWLDTLPAQQPLWLLAELEPGGGPASRSPEQQLQEIRCQLPAALQERLIGWSGEAEQLEQALAPVRRQWRQEGRQRLALTQRRRLEELHGQWQAELESLRRRHFQRLLQRTQWVVAAGVFAAPLASLDLLVLAVANGLMLQEMARLWRCSWSLLQLREAALELGRAALALGVAEWSSQALAGVLRLHGATWLVGGALQALSAAYLTRVVGRAMADVMALSAGVTAPDLEAIKRQAPLLVARAAEAERLDWASFLDQARQWLPQQPAPLALPQG
ncbi:MAG: YcjF family protein [Cyanobacteriota bacterium]|nr:YcjF family protein [Cyanobacteriota bacterium]